MDTDEIVTTYCAAWNERDAAKRTELLEAAWADDGTYHDPTGTAAGRAELAARTGLSTVGQFSYNPASAAARAFAYATLTFQAAMRDPPAFVPANVDRAEVFFQGTKVLDQSFVLTGGSGDPSSNEVHDIISVFLTASQAAARAQTAPTTGIHRGAAPSKPAFGP